MGRGLCKPTLETMHGGTCLLYMKYQQIGIPPEEAQFLETRKFQLDEIARLYRILPHMIGDLEKSSFNNIEQQSMEFVKYTLDFSIVYPPCCLFPPLGDTLCFQYNPIPRILQTKKQGCCPALINLIDKSGLHFQKTPWARPVPAQAAG